MVAPLINLIGDLGGNLFGNLLAVDSGYTFSPCGCVDRCAVARVTTLNFTEYSSFVNEIEKHSTDMKDKLLYSGVVELETQLISERIPERVEERRTDSEWTGA